MGTDQDDRRVSGGWVRRLRVIVLIAVIVVGRMFSSWRLPMEITDRAHVLSTLLNHTNETVEDELIERNKSNKSNIINSINNNNINNYVVLSTTLNSFARKEDYDYLVPLVARNWWLFGFLPIVIVIATSNEMIQQIKPVWDIVMPQEALLVPILAPPDIAISVAQISRLYAAEILTLLRDSNIHNNTSNSSSNIPDDDAFMRITDADMMIHDSQPFLPIARANISIFNGDCCLSKVHRSPDGKKMCREYPMHSVGMEVRLWRELFPLAAQPHEQPPGGTTATARIVAALMQARFNVSNATGRSKRTTKDWYADQILLGCAIGDAMENGYSVELLPGPGRNRLHVRQSHLNDAKNNSNSDDDNNNDNNNNISSTITFIEVHLANFQLARHSNWMDNLVNKSNVLAGYESKYREYSQAWTRFRPPPSNKFDDSETIQVMLVGKATKKITIH